MTHISTLVSPQSQGRGGGRIASPAYRHSLAICEEFAGLEEGVSRYDLLLLVKKAGKLIGVSPRMMQLLDYYYAFSRDCDWAGQGSRPIVYQSLARTALDLGVSERQIQKLETALFQLGVIGFHDSGNHKRYGQRDPQTGRILFAYGVDLSPLVALRPALEAKLQEKQLYDAAWLETKRQVSWYRRQLRAHLAEWGQGAGTATDLAQFELDYAEIAFHLRTHIPLADLRTLLARHKGLHSRLLAAMGVETAAASQQAQQSSSGETARECSSRSERTDVHYKSTTQQSSDKSESSSPTDQGFQKSVVEPTEPADLILATGLQHLTLKQAVVASSDRLRGHLPLASRPLNWNDLVEAAYQVRRELHVSQQSWGEACQLLGRIGAAVCVIVADRAALRADDPVRMPAAYFRGMVNKARSGELRLQASLCGLIESQRDDGRRPEILTRR